MTRASAIALQASWAAQEADELAQMRQRARERLAEIDAEGVDWAGLKDLSAGRMTAWGDAVVAELGAHRTGGGARSSKSRVTTSR